MEDEFEWDEDKNSSNLKKHKIKFEMAAPIWDGFVLERPDVRKDYREDRIVAVGKVQDRFLTVVFTWRDGRRRIFSARRANKNEQRAYHQALTRRPEADDG